MRITVINHVASQIAASPDAVWEDILDELVDARKFRELGYTIAPLDDLAGGEGGYRMRLQQEGMLIDERSCLVTKLDRSQRRLSMTAESQTAERLLVYVTYHAAPALTGTRYAIDCHSSLDVDVPEVPGGADPRSKVHDLTRQFEVALSGYLAAAKVRLEAATSTPGVVLAVPPSSLGSDASTEEQARRSSDPEPDPGVLPTGPQAAPSEV